MNSIFMVDKKKVKKRFFSRYIFLFALFGIYELIRKLIGTNYEINTTPFIVMLIVLLWNILTEKNISKLEFNDFDRKFTVTEFTLFGKEKSYLVGYEKLNFEIENSNRFWTILRGRKVLSVLKNKMELFLLDKYSGFTMEQIFQIEQNLLAIKMPADNSVLAKDGVEFHH